jgi:hypothetical protein
MIFFEDMLFFHIITNKIISYSGSKVKIVNVYKIIQRRLSCRSFEVCLGFEFASK